MVYFQSPEKGDSLKEALKAYGQGLVVEVHPLKDLPDQVEAGVDAVLLDYEESPALDRWIEAITSNPQGPAIFLFLKEITTDGLWKALRLGVNECFTLPLKEDKFRQALCRIQPRSSVGELPGEKTRILAFMGCKGGVGTTMLTANVGYLMAQRKKTTLLVDLDLNYSQLVHFFDIKSKYTIISLLENLDHLDSATLPSLLPAYQNSLHLLPGPARLEEAEAVTPENLEKIIRTLKTTQFFQWILLDVGNRPNEIALKALELANELVLVTVPSVPALLNTRKFLKLLHIIGLENLTLHLLVNIWKKNGNLTLPEAAKLLGREVSFTVSCNYEEVGRSINEGRPLAELSPRLPISRDLEQVAAGLMGDRGPEENGLLGNIFKFFKGKG